MAELLRTPLHARHVRLNARMVPFGGWDMPVQYAGVVPEHAAVRTGVGVFDVSHMARLHFAGGDVLPFLESVFTNAVGTMAAGQVRYGVLCNDAGGILDDVLVYRMPARFEMVVNASNRQKILAWFAARTGGTDVIVTDATFDTALVAVQGPKAVGILAGLFPPEILGLKYYHAAESRFGGRPCVVSRTGYTGEDGFEITVPKDRAEALWDEVTSRGAVPCGLGARDTLRLEAAMPLYGHELSETVTPLEAGLGWAVKLDKGEFAGRDALTRHPPKVKRVGLEIVGKRAAREGSPLLDSAGVQVGTVTSGSFVPFLEKSVAMGYVPVANATPGTALGVDVRGSVLSATVVKLPFYSRKK